MTLTEPTQEDGTERASMGMGIEFMSLTQTPIMPPNYEPLYLSCSPFNIYFTKIRVKNKSIQERNFCLVENEEKHRKIAKVGQHKFPGKSSLKVSFVCPV